MGRDQFQYYCFNLISLFLLLVEWLQVKICYTTIIVSNPDLVFQNYRNLSYLHVKHLKYSTVYMTQKNRQIRAYSLYPFESFGGS